MVYLLVASDGIHPAEAGGRAEWGCCGLSRTLSHRNCPELKSSLSEASCVRHCLWQPAHPFFFTCSISLLISRASLAALFALWVSAAALPRAVSACWVLSVASATFWLIWESLFMASSASAFLSSTCRSNSEKKERKKLFSQTQGL